MKGLTVPQEPFVSHALGEPGWTALAGTAMTSSTLLQGRDGKEKAKGEKRGKMQYFTAGGRVGRQAGGGAGREADPLAGTPLD